MDSHPDSLRWFPLVARPRPACPPLNTRLDDINATIQKARKATGSEALTLAAVALNKTALIASDCGLPDLAESLCLQQLQTYQDAAPLGTQAVRNALEPVVNIARLRIRAGQPDDGYLLLSELLKAAKERSTIAVGDHKADLDQLMTGGAWLDTVQWLWKVMLADGTRALTSAGRWAEALESVSTQNGIGDRLLDGRQVAVITHHLAGRQQFARDLLSDTRAGERWESPVHLTLSALCDPTKATDLRDLPQLLQQAAGNAGLVVFRTRVLLTATELAAGSGADLVQALHGDRAIYADGYAARDVLSHPTSDHLNPANCTMLAEALSNAGLDGSVSRRQLRSLIQLSRQSYRITRRHLPDTAR
ncbi:hypothetical protein ACI2LF_23985 [Kribbella sp. NPDC020789]